jgi:hypothetical protein
LRKRLDLFDDCVRERVRLPQERSDAIDAIAEAKARLGDAHETGGKLCHSRVQSGARLVLRHGITS